MLDIKWIREHPEQLDDLLRSRGMEPLSGIIQELDNLRRQCQTLIQKLRQAKNQAVESLRTLPHSAGSETDTRKRDIMHIDAKLCELEAQDLKDQRLQIMLESLPNILSKDVPHGTDANSNVVIRTWGKTEANGTFKHHFDLAEQLGLVETVKTVEMSGSRFVTLKGALAMLSRALINFMLNTHINVFGFTELVPPYLVKEHAMQCTGHLPKFASDSFVTTDGYRLIPTAEVPLVNMVHDTILTRDKLPIRYVAYSPCFRSEAGSAGRDTKGMIRLHQFHKVEIVMIATPEHSYDALEEIVKIAEHLLQLLKLPYRVMVLCSGEVGFSAYKTYDVEVWLAGQNRYCEISSCSNCAAFQARRLNARYKDINTQTNMFVHTLNGSALAIDRTIAAIMEFYQNPDGSIAIPQVLVPYMNGLEVISVVNT